MATSLYDLTLNAQTELLDRIRDGQRTFVAALATAAEPLERALPAGPKLSLPAGVPTTQRLVDDSYSLTIRLLETQRAFTLDVLNLVVSPVLRKLTGHAPKAA